jgi:broad specificity phosphatase PhoE
MRVLLIRHGRSAHAPPGGLLDRAGVERWRAAYDEAGTASEDRPPAGLAREVARASVIATSDLPRAAASAAHLARGRAVTTSPLFREVPLPIPDWLPFRAPFTVWEALIHLRWGVDLF